MGESLAKKQQRNPRHSRERPCWTVRFRDSRQDGYAKTIWQKGRIVKQEAEKNEAPLQTRPRLGQLVGLVVLEGQPAEVQRPGDEAEHLLVANLYLYMPITPDPLGDGREQLLDVLLIGGRLHHAAPGFW
jgi:hypothetical protein